MYGHKRVRVRRGDALSRVAWDQLEVLLASWYRRQGYEVEHTGTAASGSKYDGGIDLKLRRPGEYVLVQVKHWNAYKVPHNDVHQLLGLMVNEGATGAILITSGEFTKAAIEAATRHGHVRLIDGVELRAVLGPLPEPATPQLSSLLRGERDDARVFFIKAAFALVATLFVLFYVNRALHSVFDRIGSAGMQTSINQSRPQPLKARAAGAPAVVRARRVDSCREVIDKPSGTYIDRCVPVVSLKKPTAAEIAESKRKADEAIRVLAPNTPEM